MRIFLFIIAVFFSAAFTVQQSAQPVEERTAQNALPQAKDALWKRFLQCDVQMIEDTKNDVYHYKILYTPEVKALVGKELSLSGFMMPLEPAEKFNHFILSKRTPTCPFCPPGDPNEIVDVWTEKPVEYNENIIHVTGTLRLIDDQDIGMFFKLEKASIH